MNACYHINTIKCENCMTVAEKEEFNRNYIIETFTNLDLKKDLKEIKTYYRISQFGQSVIVDSIGIVLDEVNSLEENSNILIEKVKMTEEEYNKIPEFQGW